jgi:malonate decarboxylase gamma subunit
MTLLELLKQIFPDGNKVVIDDNIVHGEGLTASGTVEIIGTCNNTTIGIREILSLSKRFINVMQKNPGRPILMLVDNNGQKMALEDELLGLNQYIGHLVKLQDLARRQGHKVIALVYGNSIAGGFVAFGLCAGHTYALADSNTSVMSLPAISRVTKLPLEYLEELSRTVPVFAPGVKNFFQTGGLEGIWEGDLNACLEKALKEDQSTDRRAELGAQRGGRPMAFDVARKIANDK